jgi:hypothetical protein
MDRLKHRRNSAVGEILSGTDFPNRLRCGCFVVHETVTNKHLDQSSFSAGTAIPDSSQGVSTPEAEARANEIRRQKNWPVYLRKPWVSCIIGHLPQHSAFRDYFSDNRIL